MKGNVKKRKETDLQECAHMNVESWNWKRKPYCLNKSGEAHSHNVVKINDRHSQKTEIEYA
jgi:hypothetical protein